ncbi:ABC transporter [Clostridium sulfidigenes]|uniref:ABC transporter n=1 Tax=Clostridium sulfidigenes TaxID=318464 RepID=A0A084J7A1_9CLOT|nr:ABC transporter ATP-binding protein [Clostridium sulfidigenes]KEZ84835.1 ABC transporter [Clostridium sulfidigenes]
MFKLIKYLKNSVVPIIIIIGLLIVQAVCDLSLPDYTSNIVNVGIQQGGVEKVTPEVIRKSQLEKLELFISEEDRIEIKSNYTLLDKDSLSDEEYNKYVKKYPSLENEGVYKLTTKKKDKETIEKLNGIFARPMLVVQGFESDSEESKAMKAAIIAKFPPNMGIDENADILEVMSQLPQEQRDTMMKDIDKNFENLPNTMIDQAAISYVKNEYNNIGLNIDKMQTNYLLYTGGLMILIALLSMAATVTVGFIGARVAANLGKNLRSKVFSKVIGFSNAELDKFSTASLITRSTNDIQQIQMLMVMLLRVVFYAPILGIGGVIKVLNTETSMAWIIVVAVVAISAVVIVLFTVVMPRFKRVQKLVDRINLVTREILTGMMVIRAFSTERHEEKRFDKANNDLTKNNLFVNRTMALMMPTMMLIMNGITILIVWSGSHSIDAGTMQVGDMMAFIQYTMQIIMAFLMISMVSVMLPRATVSAGRIDEVLSTEYVVKDPVAPIKLEEDKKGFLKFNNVSFKYPNAEENVLSNITFTAMPGETTAFIGSTGSGKSTLINLVPRFYDVTEGEILLDGIDIRKVSQHDLREKIGYVPQKGVLFSGTIESNLKYSGKSITDEDMIKAAEIAQATDFIKGTKESYNTEISQGGTNVSGGQKQRLSIARAIAKKPEVYIFDDSFSALDFKTDAALRKALKKETLNSTVLIVAQRISTILHAEQIIVLEEGRIAGIGTHNELMKTCDVYKQIALSQLSKEELANE